MDAEKYFDRLKKIFLNHLWDTNEKSCLLWTGYLNPLHGRAYVTMKDADGKSIGLSVHRMAWILNRGPIPQGKHVLHTCDTGNCANVDHLYLGDHKQNMRDMAERRRASSGSRHHNALLNEEKVSLIKTELRKGKTIASLGREYGVSRTAIANIKNGKNWIHVQPLAGTVEGGK